MPRKPNLYRAARRNAIRKSPRRIKDPDVDLKALKPFKSRLREWRNISFEDWSKIKRVPCERIGRMYPYGSEQQGFGEDDQTDQQ